MKYYSGIVSEWQCRNCVIRVRTRCRPKQWCWAVALLKCLRLTWALPKWSPRARPKWHPARPKWPQARPKWSAPAQQWPVVRRRRPPGLTPTQVGEPEGIMRIRTSPSNTILTWAASLALRWVDVEVLRCQNISCMTYMSDYFESLRNRTGTGVVEIELVDVEVLIINAKR